MNKIKLTLLALCLLAVNNGFAASTISPMAQKLAAGSFISAIKSGNQTDIANNLKVPARLNFQGSNGMTPLMVAVEVKNVSLVRDMMALNPNLELRNNAGETALDLARKSGNTEIISLLRGGAAITAKPTIAGLTAAVVHKAEEFKPTIALAPVISKLHMGGDGQNRLNQELFSAIATNQSMLNVATLVEKGADVNYKNPEIYSFYTDKNRSRKTMFGQVKGVTPLMIAAYNGNVSLVAGLLEKGADINLRNEDCDTAFSLAVKKYEATNIPTIEPAFSQDPRYQDPHYDANQLIAYLNLGETIIHLAKKGAIKQVVATKKAEEDLVYVMDVDLEVIPNFFRYSSWKTYDGLVLHKRINPVNNQLAGEYMYCVSGQLSHNPAPAKQEIRADTPSAVPAAQAPVQVKQVEPDATALERSFSKFAEEPRGIMPIREASRESEPVTPKEEEEPSVNSAEIRVQQLNKNAFSLIDRLSRAGDLADIEAIRGTIERLIHDGADVNAVDSKGNSMLMNLIIQASQFRNLATFPELAGLFNLMLHRSTQEAVMRKNLDGQTLIDMLTTVKLPPFIDPLSSGLKYRETKEETKGWFKGKESYPYDTNRELLNRVLERFTIQLSQKQKEGISKRLQKLIKTDDLATETYHNE